MIEYLMVYMPSGLPIYSKCFSGFCKANATDDILLSGFLSALESFPTMVGGEALKAVEMGNTSFIFRKTTPSGSSVAMGVSKGADLEEAQDVFNQIQILLEEKYNTANWDVISPSDYEAFKKDLLENTLEPALHKYGGFEDRCQLGDQCAMGTTAIDTEKQPIWSRFRSGYTKMRAMMMDMGKMDKKMDKDDRSFWARLRDRIRK